MKNINYKIVSIVLASILAIILVWKAVCFLTHHKHNYKMKGSHKMENGIMMDDKMMAHEMMGDMNMEEAMSGMMGGLVGKDGAELEKAFLKEMIIHHDGAVEMAKVITSATNTKKEIKDFANKIITAQEGEIKQMNVWLLNYK